MFHFVYKENEEKKRGYLENLRSWFVVCFGIFGHQINVLCHGIDTFVVSNLFKQYTE